MASVTPNTQIIGIVHRKDGFAGVSYIAVKADAGIETDPLIEFKENDIDVFPKLDEYYIRKLKQLGKNEQGIMQYCTSLLTCYFGDNVFHNMVYEKVKDLFEEILGML